MSKEAVRVVNDLEVCGGVFFTDAKRGIVFVGMVDQ